MSDETIQLEADNAYDTTSPDIEGVRKFMEESAREAVEPPPEEKKVDTASKEWDGQPINMSWGDTTFDAEASPEESESEAYDALGNTFDGFTYKITDEDKETFLLSAINGEPYKATIKLLDGKLSIRCVDMSDYAKQVVLHAAAKHMRSISNLSQEYARVILSRYRAVLQLESVNGRAVKQHFVPALTGGDLYGSLDRDADKLIANAAELQCATPGTIYILYVKALAAFERQLGVLVKAAFDGTFWQPADRGL